MESCSAGRRSPARALVPARPPQTRERRKTRRRSSRSKTRDCSKSRLCLGRGSASGEAPLRSRRSWAGPAQPQKPLGWSAQLRSSGQPGGGDSSDLRCFALARGSWSRRVGRVPAPPPSPLLPRPRPAAGETGSAAPASGHQPSSPGPPPPCCCPCSA